MKIKSIAVACALCAASISALAGDWYLAGSVGQSTIRDTGKARVDAALISSGVTGLKSSLDDSDTGFKLQLGYKFGPNWAVEGGYVDLGKFNYHATFSGPTAGAASADVKATGWNIAGLAIWPINDKFSMFAKLGAIDARVEENAMATGSGVTANGNISSTKVKAHYGLGATFNLSKEWSLRAEWERFDKLGDKNKTGESDVDLLSIGVSFNF